MRHVPLVLALAAAPVAAQQQSAAATEAASRAAARRTLEAVRRSAAIALDGRLDDAAWRSAAVADGFVQQSPHHGAAPSQRTEVRLVYDDDALWIGARLYDTDPAAITARLGRRDGHVQSDWFFVLVDSYFDRQTGFLFAVNPRGVRYDAQVSQDINEDGGWDALWDAATGVDGEGWVVEMRIPLSQLRFRGGDGARTWGLNFRRYVERLDETHTWSPLPAGGAANVSVAGELTGLEGLTPGRRLEILPYTVAGLTRAPGEAADPFHAPNATHGAVGADLRYGVTSDLTFSLTVNPDFGQVEADPSVVNLSGFETFFPERRQFFLEGVEIFQPAFPAFPSVFHPRRIGRPPQGQAASGATYAELPDATRIIAAGKLTGRAGGWTVGLFDAVTAPEEAQWVDDTGLRGRNPVEPRTNYGVVRLARAFGAGRSSIGFIGTSTLRALPASGELDFLTTSAWLGGLDGRHRLGDRFELAGSLLFSDVRGSAAAIDRIQRSPVHRFNRPDAGYTGYDPAATGLRGYAASGRLRTLRGNWRVYAEARLRSPGFEINDLGYVGRADRIATNTQLSYRRFTPGRLFRSFVVGSNQWSNHNYGGQRSWTGFDGFFEGQLANQWFISLGNWYNLSRMDDDELRGGPALRAGAEIGQWLHLSTDRRKAVSASFGGSFNEVFERNNRLYQTSAELLIRPSDRMDLAAGPAFTWRTEPMQFVANAGGAYVRGHITQRTAAMTLRLNYTFSPTLSLQAYAQPFVASGAYDRFARVADPAAAAYDERIEAYAADQVALDPVTDRYLVDADRDGMAEFGFARPDFNVREFQSNVVLRWEYRPGSTAYLVWSSGRGAFAPDGSFALGRDLTELFRAPGTNRFLVKVSYWLGG